MKKKFYIESLDLKSFLRLFPEGESICELELGDTQHKRKGFISEIEFPGINTVDDILNLNYNFGGLVLFNCEIGSVNVCYKNFEGGKHRFEVMGNVKEFRAIKNKSYELNVKEKLVDIIE